VTLMDQFKSIINYFTLNEDQTDKLDRFHQNLGDLMIDINQILYKRNPSLYELIQIHLSLVNSSVRIYFFFFFVFIISFRLVLII
jgi:hypothetical protein